MIWSLRSLVLLVAAVFLFHGCSNDTTPPATTPPPKTNPPGTYNYQLIASNVHALDSTTAQYVLWFWMTNGEWRKTPLASWATSNATLTFSGKVTVPVDSVVRVVFAIEPKAIPSSPSAKLLAATFDTANRMSSLTPNDSEGVGTYAAVTASLIFTTKSSDTNRAKSEFYFMHDSSGTFIAGLHNLNVPPAGWTYSVWVVDSNFYPQRHIYYGSFSSPDGADSYAKNDTYPFPGGYNPASLNDPGAHILITIDPLFLDTTKTASGPSPYTIALGRLSRFINYNDTLALQNSWKNNVPSGTLRLF